MSGTDSVEVGRPGAVLDAAALAFGLATLGLVGTVSTVALGGSALGVLALVGGVALAGRRLRAFGTVVLFGSVLAAGATGAPGERLLPAIATAVLAWNCSNAAVTTRTELREGTAVRAELLHVGTAAGAGAVGVAVASLGQRLLSFSPSVVGVFFLAVAAVFLALALGE